MSVPAISRRTDPDAIVRPRRPKAPGQTSPRPRPAGGAYISCFGTLERLSMIAIWYVQNSRLQSYRKIKIYAINHIWEWAVMVSKCVSFGHGNIVGIVFFQSFLTFL